MRRLRWVALLTALVLSVRAHAQSVAAGVTRHAPHASGQDPRSIVADTSQATHFGLRFLTGIGGATAGLFVGARVGPAILGRDCGGCDDPGLAEAMIGALVGTITGAAIAAALPQGSSPCGFGDRFGHALTGSTIGGALGALLSGGTAVIFFSVPFVAAGGGAVAAEKC